MTVRDKVPAEMPSTTEHTPLLTSDTPSDHVTNCEPPLSKDHDGLEDSTLPEASVLGRKLGWSSAYILVISRVIGSGIFAMPGIVIQRVGSPGLALALWVAGAFMSLAGLTIDIEYGAMLPRSGGVKVYLEYTYRSPRFLASILVTVHAVLLGFTAANCIMFAKYAIFAANMVPTGFKTKIVASGLLAFITIVHGCFNKAGLRIQNVLGWLKIALAVFMIMTGFAVLFIQRDTPLKWEHVWTDSQWEWSVLPAAFLQVLYSYAGLENINNVMNEVKNPIRTVKTVGPAALFTACTMYLLINLAYLAVIPLDQIKQSRELIAALFFERLGFGHTFLPIAIALNAAGNVMVVVYSLARFKQEIARKGLLPFSRFFASNRPFGSPMGGLILHFVPSILVITLPPSDTIYSFIAEVEGYAGQFFGLAVAVGLIILRYKKPDIRRPFKAWLPAVWLRVAFAISLILAPWISLWSAPAGADYSSVAYAILGISVLMIGVAYWLVLTIAIPWYNGSVLDEAIINRFNMK